MTITQRDTLQKFAGGHLPLNRAIAAALHAIDRQAAEIERLRGEVQKAKRCPQCKGAKRVWYALRGMETCETCRGTGERP